MTTEGFTAGIARRSKVQRLAWALKGAPMRKKDLKLNALCAIAGGRTLLSDCTAKIIEAGGESGDVVVVVVFARADNLAKMAEPVLLGAGRNEEDSSDLEAVRRNTHNVCVGFVVGVRAQGHYITSTRPLILEPNALAVLDTANCGLAVRASHS